ncbi:DUF922 domain-containing protein [Pontibacter vulgaris]|uniref:DUF922 domain-containing protein n=1 Tax=Pontibacter vulgaris TaxID=2905679 RepID=UPI001FA70A2B|nr:DUF922 domain-containing protein [Pontibacter vulgaris]
MKRFSLLIIGLILSFSGYSQSDDTLPYDSKTKLTWQDFNGKPNYADRSKGAEITVSIFLKVRETSFWSGGISYDAYAVAFKNDSWVKAGYKDDYSLKHEQLHFDIAHLYAESLEIELNSLDRKTLKQKDLVQQKLQEQIRLMQEYQDLYDRQTYGGNNTRMQKVWENKIKKEFQIIHI